MKSWDVYIDQAYVGRVVDVDFDAAVAAAIYEFSVDHGEWLDLYPSKEGA